MNELSIFDSLLNGHMENAIGFPRFSSEYEPRVDIVKRDDSYVLKMELPGRSEKDVDVQIEKGILTISSRKEECKEVSENENAEKTVSEEKYLLRERKISEFSRSFEFSDDVDVEKASASFANGILEISLPRKEKPLPKKIEIKVA
jgi:heat shock protein hsp20